MHISRLADGFASPQDTISFLTTRLPVPHRKTPRSTTRMTTCPKVKRHLGELLQPWISILSSQQCNLRYHCCRGRAVLHAVCLRCFWQVSVWVSAIDGDRIGLSMTRSSGSLHSQNQVWTEDSEKSFQPMFSKLLGPSLKIHTVYVGYSRPSSLPVRIHICPFRS